MEARVGIEPTMELLQSPALPLGYPASEERRLYRRKGKSQLCYPPPNLRRNFHNSRGL